MGNIKGRNVNESIRLYFEILVHSVLWRICIAPKTVLPILTSDDFESSRRCTLVLLFTLNFKGFLTLVFPVCTVNDEKCRSKYLEISLTLCLLKNVHLKNGVISSNATDLGNLNILKYSSWNFSAFSMYTSRRSCSLILHSAVHALFVGCGTLGMRNFQ